MLNMNNGVGLFLIFMGYLGIYTLLLHYLYIKKTKIKKTWKKEAFQ